MNKWLPVICFPYQYYLPIKRPNKDTCQTCDELNTLIQFSEDETTLKEADVAYNANHKDKQISKVNPTIKTITFDMQQCLPVPVTFNFTVHDCDEHQAHCFVWDGSIAERGANEVSSCLYKYLLSLEPCVTHIAMYSDTCGGQNKNSHMSAVYLMALQNFTTLKTIDHKFHTPGHTHIKSHTDHSIIEKKRANFAIPIQQPHDWAQLIQLTSEEFLDYAGLLKTTLQLRKEDIEGNKIHWSEVKGKARPYLTPHKRYNGPQSISAAKKNDLLGLLPFINPTFHHFYKSLNSNNNLTSIQIQSRRRITCGVLNC
ncbi:hypothetical protein PR048_011508 [Dryococelus australis]|uniref:Uncharacterized protein n=1 Tax=Dryococelus australis TaxID=614101 RepID=A0ABQ9HLT8_9NEOP|nr:hypothetical protein PR048_011508 [Dryococelus australis]